MKNGCATVIVLLGALLAGPAWSQDQGFYIGGSFGRSDVKDGCTDVPPGLSCDNKDSAWKVFGGYQFNQHFAAELGYGNLGTATASGTVGGFSANASVEATALEVVGIGSIPVSNGLSLFAKLGMYRGETDATATATGGGASATVSDSDSNTDVTFGFGVRYDFTKNFGMRAEWQRYASVGGDNVGESDVDVVSVGVLVRF